MWYRMGGVWVVYGWLCVRALCVYGEEQNGKMGQSSQSSQREVERGSVGGNGK